jgi:dTDP-4-amino-4,6-dideoxygalactose transaminase
MSAPDIGEAELRAVTSVLATRQLSIGPQIEAFEHALSQLIGVRHAAGVNSGTAGLHLAMIAAEVTDGDIVITTPFSFVASANCILYQRGIPVFVDADPITGNLDPEQVSQAASDLAQGGKLAWRWLPRPLRDSAVARRMSLKSILPVHVFGQPADMDAIGAVARNHQLTIIEDACEAIGAQYKGRPAGSMGDAAVFAFYPNKQMTTGEGGVVLTNHDRWAELFRSLRNQGRDAFDAWLNHSRLGYNYRLDEMSAALGIVQLNRLDELLSKRARVAAWYTERLRDIEWLELPRIVSSTTRMSWFVFVIRLAPHIDRNRLMSALEAEGIPSRPYFSPIHLQPFYVERFGYQPGDFQVTENLARTSLALPFSSVMTQDQVDLVAATLIRIGPQTAGRRD